VKPVQIETKYKSWDMLCEGYTIKQVCEKLKLTSDQVHIQIRRARTHNVGNTIDDKREFYSELEVARLDLLQSMLMAKVNATVETAWQFKKGRKVEEGEEPEFPDYRFVAAEVEKLDLQIVDRILAIMDKRAKYLGLYQATEVNHTARTLEDIVLSSFRAKSIEAKVVEKHGD